MPTALGLLDAQSLWAAEEASPTGDVSGEGSVCSVMVASDGWAGAPSRSLAQAGFPPAMCRAGGDAMNQTHCGKPDPFPRCISPSSLGSLLSHSYLHGAASVTWGAFGHPCSSAAPWDRAVPQGPQGHVSKPGWAPTVRRHEWLAAHGAVGNSLVANMPSSFVEQHREARRKPPG